MWGPQRSLVCPRYLLEHVCYAIIAQGHKAGGTSQADMLRGNFSIAMESEHMTHVAVVLFNRACFHSVTVTKPRHVIFLLVYFLTFF